MPIYAYRCSSCGYEQDVLQKISAAPLTDCPSCGKPDFHKQLSAPAFQLKGTGWYVTDFRDNGTRPAGKTGQDAQGGSRGGDPTGDSSSAAATDGDASSSRSSSSSSPGPASVSTGGSAATGSAGAASGSD